MNFEFYKMHGTGNDFIVVDNFTGMLNDWPAEFVQTICQAHTGIGADGLLIIERTPAADFRMRFFNADGYESDMCVNGSRCICYMAHYLKIVGHKFRFLAGDGVHSAEILPERQVKIQVLLHAIQDNRTFPVDFELPDSLYFIKFLNTGVPHVVLQTSDQSDAPVERIGSALRFHSYYQPQGANVNFVQVLSNTIPFRLKIRTFERGVDAETLSCGSGATAAALSFFASAGFTQQRVQVETRGGDLTVSFTGNGENIYLQGPVRIVFKGTYFKEDT